MIRKNLDLIFVGIVVLAIIEIEETVEIAGEMLHLFFELCHLVFEYVELGVDEVVEHIFHKLEIGEFLEYLFITERHASQFFTFYILMSFIGLILYKLAKFAPAIYQFIKQQILVAWIRRKTQIQLNWRSLTQLNKIFIITSALTVLFLASFFVI